MSVFANGREVSGKATPNKIIAAFPSVCLSPPSPPAGPIPIPYPLFTDAGKTGDGTGSVKIKKKEVGKKNGSTYTKSQGNEPATRSFGMDVVSHTISGKNKHQAYSFDVLFEKAGAERFLDFTTTNHGSDPATAAGIDAAKPAPGAAPSVSDCSKLESNNRSNRRKKKIQDRDTGRKKRNGKPITFKESGTLCSGYAYAGAAGMYQGMSLTSKLTKAFKNLFAPSAKKKENQTEPGFEMNFCKGACPNHPGGGAEAHAELNVLNRMASQPGVSTSPGSGTKVLLNIDWKPYGKKKAKVPCSKCEKTMKCACDNGCLDIYLCDSSGQPKPFCKSKKGSV